MTTRPVIVGLLGGVAAGKSTVARGLARRGARVVDADALAHEVLADTELRDRLTALFGPGVLDGEGRPDRRRIGEIAFRDPEKLRALEALVHPRVRARIRTAIDAAGAVPAVVIDAPLLLEGGLFRIADVLVFVSAPAAARRERAARDRGWTDGEIERREGRQAPLDEKERAAAIVIRNDGGPDDLEAGLDDLWKELLRRAEEKHEE